MHNSKEGGSKEGEGGDTVRKEVERERLQFVEGLKTGAQDATVTPL